MVLERQSLTIQLCQIAAFLHHFKKTQIQIIDFEFFLPVPYPPTSYGIGEGVADSVGDEVGVGLDAAALLISSLY